MPRDASSAAWTRTLPSVALSAIVSPGMVTPGGKASAETARAPSAPLVRTTLTGIVGAEALGDLDRLGRRRRASRASPAPGATTRPYSVIELVGRFVCLAKTTGLAATRSIGPLVPWPRPTSLIGAAGNRASGGGRERQHAGRLAGGDRPRADGQAGGRIDPR